MRLDGVLLTCVGRQQKFHDRIRRSLRFIAGGLCFLLAGSCGFAEASARSLDVAEVGSDSVSLTEYFAVLEDPGLALTLADVQQPEIAARFKGDQTPAPALLYGYTRSAYWLRLHLRNASDQSLERLLQIDNALLVSVQLHQPTAAGAYQSLVTGNGLPFASRLYPNRTFVFPLTLPARSEQVIYLRFQSSSTLGIPAQLWRPQAFRTHERNDYIAQAWYFGMATAMLLFNLLLFAMLRDGTYLLLVSHIACSAVTFAALNGLGRQFLWPDASFWPEINHYIGLSVSVVSLCLFARSMLETRTRMPRMDRALMLLSAFFLLSVVGFIVAFDTVVRLALPLLAAANLVLIGVGVLGTIRRQRSAYFFLAACGMLFIGALVNNLKVVGVLPTNMLTINVMQIGSALMMILLAFALADRFNQLRREKEAAQRDALLAQKDALRAQHETLLAEQRVTEALRASERLLEGRVNERTAELSATVDRLKQTQAELVQAEKLASLGSLVAGVAHELNTPIGTALTTASTLEDDSLAFQRTLAGGGLKRSALEAFLQRSVDMGALLVRSCHRAAELITSFKRVAVDQTSEQQREFDLLDLVQDNLAALRPSFKNAKWTFAIDVPAGIICDGYPGPLGQVLTNLIQNAAVHAFTADARGGLTISAAQTGNMVDLIVSDNGKGMSAGTLSHVFEPFFTTRLGQGGSGLGLAICHNIVGGLLGGVLTATSELGVGTRFTVHFPIRAPQRQDTAGALN